MRAERMRVGIRCDAGPAIGVGHLMRCTALAEELVARGHEVIVLAALGGMAFAERQLSSRGLRNVEPPVDAPDMLRAVEEHGLDAVVIDSYVLAPEVSAGLVRAEVPVLAVVDGPFRGQSAQLYLDQNLGAEKDDLPLPDGVRRLAGTSYALLRDAVRSLRPPAPWSPGGRTPRVVVAFGGTDAYGVTQAAAAALVGTRLPLHVTVVSPDPAVRRAVERSGGPGQVITALAPFDEFPRLLADADLVVGASGSSSWEYCCLGRPAIVVAVVENQQDAYRRLVDLGAVFGLGDLQDVHSDRALTGERLRAALADEPARAAVARAAYRLVDGDGRVRVVTALEDLVAGAMIRASDVAHPAEPSGGR